MKIAMLTILAATVVTLPVTYAAAAAKPPSYDARIKTCTAATKGLYTGEGRYVAYGACLSKAMPDAWAPQAKR
jgi:hypothetical protein